MNIVVRTSLAVVSLLIVSCSSGPQSKPPANTPPQPSWTGMWTKVDGLAIPPEKRILLPRSCENSPEYWTIDETKSQITLDLYEATYATGIKRAVERHKLEKAQGHRQGSFARLDGQAGIEEIDDGQRRPLRKFPVTYELQYDPKTEHLAGTRNGAPVRFVRADLANLDRKRCQKIALTDQSSASPYQNLNTLPRVGSCPRKKSRERRVFPSRKLLAQIKKHEPSFAKAELVEIPGALLQPVGFRNGCKNSCPPST